MEKILCEILADRLDVNVSDEQISIIVANLNDAGYVIIENPVYDSDKAV